MSVGERSMFDLIADVSNYSTKFCWNKIPGKENEKLIDSLTERLTFFYSQASVDQRDCSDEFVPISTFDL